MFTSSLQESQMDTPPPPIKHITEEAMQELLKNCSVPRAPKDGPKVSRKAIILNVSGHYLHDNIFVYLRALGYDSFTVFGSEGLYLERDNDGKSYEEQAGEFIERFFDTKNGVGLLPSEAKGVPFLIMPGYNSAVIRLVLAISSLLGPPVILDIGKVGFGNEYKVIGGFNSGNWSRWWRSAGRKMLTNIQKSHGVESIETPQVK